jgi:DhnA family fructose-bisphosphate aldolase class Ia
MESARPRLRRLFGFDDRCFDVALDHGVFDENSFLAGIESLPEAIAVVARAGPDAIQLAPGAAPLLQALPGRERPALVLRADTANVYGAPLPRTLFSELVGDPVEQALRLDAVCVVANLIQAPEQHDLHRQCVANVARLAGACARWGMPLMVEPLVMRPDAARGGYEVDGTLERIVPLVRQAFELGADVIKADPCDDLTRYREVVRVAGGTPVLARGGGRASDREILQRTATLISQGAAGIVYGRNVVQHRDPGRMTRALMALVHRGASAAEGLAILEGDDGPA